MSLEERQEMYSERYEFSAINSLLDFEFFSEGPNGKIKKVVRFTLQSFNGITYFNLGFGDWDNEKKHIDDFAKSNNNDAKKILVTVAVIVLEFTNRFPGALIYAQGSTPGRTRLYQIGIATNWEEIGHLFYVYGQIKGEWFPFVKNTNYEGFLGFRKK